MKALVLGDIIDLLQSYHVPAILISAVCITPSASCLSIDSAPISHIISTARSDNLDLSHIPRYVFDTASLSIASVLSLQPTSGLFADPQHLPPSGVGAAAATAHRPILVLPIDAIPCLTFRR